MASVSTAVAVSGLGLGVRIGDQIILEDAGFTIHEGERVGVVGRNGVGKSTLLKLMARLDLPHAGALSWKKGSDLGFLAQDVRLDPERSVRENVLDGAREVLDLIARYEAMPHTSARAQELEHRITAHNGWDIERHAAELLTRLRAPEPGRVVGTLSGGEMRRVGLCRALVGQPDLLILDEPTNHLDTDSIDWLEGCLQGYPGTLVMVTHDRYFLDRVATRILEISAGVIHSHPGNYTAFLRGKAAREEEAEKRETNRLGFLRREYEWISRGARARTTKSRSRVAAYREVAAENGLEREQDMDLIIPPAPRLGNRVIELQGVGMAFGERVLFRDLDLLITPGDKIGIVGPNGVGKTTLVQILLGRLRPTWGTVRIGELTEFNYVDQHRLQLTETQTVIQEMGDGKDFVCLGAERVSVWAYLKRFQFTDERINTLVSCLSGGERSRLLLAKILSRGGNVLVLDEPTNDLDLSTLRVLEEALADFGGCVVLVSHDRCFLNRVCTAILGFGSDGSIVLQEGDYDYYLEKRAERERESRAADPTPGQSARSVAEGAVTAGRPRRLKWKEERELEGMEAAILEAESRYEELGEQLADPLLYANSGERVPELTRELEETRDRIARLYERWEELEALRG
jgi:ATP-binding cassette subfamily F protein uup